MDENLITINGIVEEIIYQNPENGYTVFDFSSDDSLVTAVGFIADAGIGEAMSLHGKWTSHPSYGKQFEVESFERKIPETAGEMLRYLSAGTIKGIGAKTASRIVERFGERTFDVIENYPEELSLLKGISLAKAKEISAEFKKKYAVREVIIILEGYGMKASECLAAYNAFSNNTVALIKHNPYILCGEKMGLSFSRADEIAAEIGDDYSLFRLRAGIVSIVRHNLSNGHTCLPRRKVVPPASELLSADEETIENTISELISDRELLSSYIESEEFLFIPEIFRAERGIADRMQVMVKFPPPTESDPENEIRQIEKEKKIIFAEKQRLAIKTAIEKGILVLTGGPGTGKTTALKGIIDIFEKKNLKVVLAAPTGRAAKRMSDVTGKEAKTLHRLLEVTFGGNGRQVFNRNVQNPLECDAVIVDELSMVDVTVFWGLLDALPLGSRLIMVGDSDQLPPVGAGNVLRDIIDSKLLPVVALTEIFRQAKESLIVTNAHKIVSGEYPELERTDRDFFFMKRQSTSSVASTIRELFLTRLPNAYGYDPVDDIQILCTTRKGELGTVRLNQTIQKDINPPQKGKSEHSSGGVTYREGDKVMQIKNNYDLDWISADTARPGQGVFNGDIGIIQKIDTFERRMAIRFDERIVKYPFDALKELELAYAVTVHKSQGSEFDCVLMPVFNINPNLSYRNLIYTAITRAKSRIILVGKQQDVYNMVDNDKKMKRYSALKYFLTDENETAPII